MFMIWNVGFEIDRQKIISNIVSQNDESFKS